jgi:D-beta-D-heptose 7-phosphate kinase/D-beta-D-heptose 1-phosphate adenosyltransferase
MRILDEAERIQFDRLQSLKELLAGSGAPLVALIGDVMLDRFHHGTAYRLSRTAPVPSLRIVKTEESPGAAAHIATSLVSLGSEVRFFTAVGADSEGESVLQSLTNSEVDTSAIATVQDWQTLTKIRFFGSREGLVDHTQMLLQADRGGGPLDRAVSEELIDSAMSSLDVAGALVISDYDHGVVTDEAIQRLIGAAKKQKVPVIIDPKLTGLDRSVGATIATFEKRGLDLLRRRNMLKEESETIAHLFETFDWQAMLVLGGIDGTWLHTADGARTHFPCRAGPAVQQLGLHDAAVTALALALGQGRSMLDAACLANAACECILSAETSEAFVSRESLALWLDEVAWQLQVSER